MKTFKFLRGNRLEDNQARISYMDGDTIMVRTVKFDDLTDHYFMFAGLNVKRLFNIYNSRIPTVEYIRCGEIKYTSENIDILENEVFDEWQNIEVKVGNHNLLNN